MAVSVCRQCLKRPPGHFAGRLIEEAGLRGRRLGQAQISSKHAGIIINLGGASAGDILSLIRLAQTEVQRQSGIYLELEQEIVDSIQVELGDPHEEL